MKKLSIEDIKQRIEEHIANGGSIYEPRRQLPFYNNLQKLVKRIQKSGNPDFTMIDAYKLCGYDFDREFAEYLKLIELLKTNADENGFVDSIKKIKGDNSPKTLLQKMASKIKCSPSDYLILMTNYRYSKAIIATNYIEQLRKELNETYPDGNIINIKRENPTLYEKLRHVCKYSPEVGINDMQSVAEYFGLTNERFSTTSMYQHLEIKKIIKDLWDLYPDGIVKELSKDNLTLYHKAVKCAVSQNKTLKQWLESNGFNYISSQKTDRFSKTVVDSQVREKELMKARSKILGEERKTFSNAKDEYYYKKNVAMLVLNHLEQQRTK